MKYFIDCEFDGHGGPLLSMALVTPYGHRFYEVLKFDTINDPWVVENVVPHLNKRGISESAFREKLSEFIGLTSYDGTEITIVGDWPDDLMYFFKYITIGPGMVDNRVRRLTIHTHTVFGVRYKSEIPHNALEDALAIMREFD